ncbi:MAG: DUF4105 domain-containing protein [Bacteroidia bacterium]|nr:DUF4105 domain-containing protein [Bacteroidia bacterium]
MKAIIINILLNLVLFIPVSIFGSNYIQLSDSAEVGVLTCTPGIELYACFGHTAIRICDPALQIDVVYNYGTFNFNTPYFYYKFIRRELDYMLTREPYYFFEIEYKKDNRKVTEQMLNLTKEQKQTIFESLEDNYLPENMYYRYDFFFDNCATRVRDIIEKGLQNSIIYDYTSIVHEHSFRELIKPYISNQYWPDFGINIGLGLPTDKIATPHEYMLLPDYIQQFYANALIKTSDGERPLIKKTTVLINAIDTLKKNDLLFIIRPGFVFWLLFAIACIITVFNYFRKKISWWFDFILYFATGLLGIILIFLWFFTKHGVTENNLNILWAVPLHFIVAFLFIPRSKSRFVFIYIFITGIIALLSLLSAPVLPQTFHPAVIPILLTIIVRSAVASWKHK